MENSIIGRLLMSDSSGSSWQLNVADTISFCLILASALSRTYPPVLSKTDPGIVS